MVARKCPEYHFGTGTRDIFGSVCLLSELLQDTFVEHIYTHLCIYIHIYIYIYIYRNLYIYIHILHLFLDAPFKKNRASRKTSARSPSRPAWTMASFTRLMAQARKSPTGTWPWQQELSNSSIHTHIDRYTDIHVCIYIYAWIYACTYIHMYTCIHIYIYIYLCVC